MVSVILEPVASFGPTHKVVPGGECDLETIDAGLAQNNQSVVCWEVFDLIVSEAT